MATEDYIPAGHFVVEDADGERLVKKPTEPIEFPDAIHGWFSLSYASYLVMPRSVLQAMPQEWQVQFVAMLDELQEKYGHLIDTLEYAVKRTDVKGPDPLANYRYPIQELLPRVDGEVTP
jgi:hypothetical protein